MLSYLYLPICLMLTAVLANCTIASAFPDREYLVGVHYFAGWWRESPNKWSPHGREWLLDYPERTPLLGLYNDQQTMDREIAIAAEYGVDFFQILYYPQVGVTAEPQQARLNDGLRTFLNSPNNHLMRFCVEYVNHPPFDLPTEDAWSEACKEWCAAMKHPGYLRVGGRPVFKVHSVHHLIQQSGGDITKMNARLDLLRRAVQDCGLPNPIIAGGVGVAGIASGEAVAGFDFLTTYMEFADLPSADDPYPYERLIRYAQKGWIAYAMKSDKPYMPYVPAGWDPRPWKDPRPPYEPPTRGQWRFALRRVQAALDRYPSLGIPAGDGRVQKAFVIYAWNEFGEGGYLAPTKGEGAMKLEAIREVFGR